ncbi:putative M28 family peptidase (homolog to aminopeptidase YwaD) (plasmid) [Natrialba magadii ATCC 43099]|uniref:Carboxypeptidase Q n=1 Tax=Natrialba magadii (strain ATCC 43099 / DSM 3394 / CCM 3739 / CIP 104546 / IAM 13178 / JCM 8861 / NBRC 102185 / NCIMB 2190 / MS3) TaxID=547559 RepID=D3T1S1_NATMM|nr:M28 family metallopeptidase [Natrialba magadii]ADD07530.1 putative M28 family peptidase (homolog to aminopeptidase YwaD) [Natrialba magadii ATCC 43099]ELY26567.1 peptidase M28 [Natrialba magadii ATCC 43099]
MVSLPNQIVGDAYTSTHGWQLVEALADLRDRMPGSEGERAGADLVAEQFEEIGLDNVSSTEFQIPGWERNSASVTVDDYDLFKRSHEVVALPGTPAETTSAELIDMGHALPEDFEDVDLDGKIVMASSLTPDDYGRWVHRGEKYSYAIEAGAAGFIFVNHIEGCLPPTGSIGDRNGPGAIPAVGVSKEVGDRIKRFCRDNTTEATIAVDCQNTEATSRNIEATVGPDTEEEVLFTAHVDAHDVGDGANDNGVGCALVTEVGRLLKQIEDDLETRVRLVTFGAEETGLYGAYYWTHTHDLDQVKCVLNMDGAGYSRNLSIHTHGFDAIGEAFEEVSEEFGVPIDVESGIRPHSDHWPFVQRGIPGAQGRTTAEDSGRGWGHTHGDTLDKLDIRDLREISTLLTAGVLKLSETSREIERVDDVEIRDATEEQRFDVGMKATGSWPWGDEVRVWPWDDA